MIFFLRDRGLVKERVEQLLKIENEALFFLYCRFEDGRGPLFLFCSQIYLYMFGTFLLILRLVGLKLPTVFWKSTIVIMNEGAFVF